MPLFQYFGWVGGFLFAALFAANWCVSAPIASAPRSDVPLDQRINIRIHTDHKWPERVVFDTRSTLVGREAKDDPETDIGGCKTPAQAERQPFDAFAEIAAVSVRPCFRPPCSAGQAAERETSPIKNGTPIQNRLRPSITARKGLTFPNPPHKPQGRS
jgi:hypothetical protein